MTLKDASNPVNVIRTIISGRKIEVKVKFNHQKFQLLKILLNGEEKCFDKTCKFLLENF